MIETAYEETTPDAEVEQPVAAATNTTWQDVAAASAEAQHDAAEPEYVTDVVTVKVTDTVLAKIARENADDDLDKQRLEAELEALKEDVKAKKSEIDVVEKRIRERHEAVRSGVQSLKGKWRVVEIFDTNTIRYIDPESGLVVHERPMTASERQQDLFSRRVTTPSTIPAADEINVEDEEDVEANAAVAEDANDEDDDDVEIDANEILEAAMTPAEPQLAAPPSKPTRRGRRAGAEA